MGCTPPAICLPHMGDYHIILEGLFEMTGFNVVPTPRITTRTLELGVLHSPESACLPFKFNLGNYLEGIERGADTMLSIAGGELFGACRLNFYAECHKLILSEMGHEVQFLHTTLQDLFKNMKRLNPRLKAWTYWYSFHLQLRKLALMDRLQAHIRERIGFEKRSGELESFWRRVIGELKGIASYTDLWRYSRQTIEEASSIEIERPERPLKVGLIGELYLLMEPFSNFNVERTLGSLGVEVRRWVSLTNSLHHELAGARVLRRMLKWAEPHVMYHLGAHGTESVARLNWMIKHGYDGAIHLKPFGCMPEINAMPALYRISRENRFPLVCFSFDSHTSESGVKTRLEAFHDMISFRRQAEAGSARCLEE